MKEQIPVLRFPEFQGAWEKRKVLELGHLEGGGTPSTKEKNFWQGKIPWVSSSDIKEDDIHTISITKFITEEAINNSATKKIPPNSILIVTRVGVGKVAFTKKTVCTSQDFQSLIIKEGDFVFLAYLIQKQSKLLLELNQGTSIKGITKNDLNYVELKIPSLSEQQKIASFLTAVDEKIQQLTKKKHLLEQYKKGLMQKIFNREIRFKDENGKNFPEWDEKRLGDLVAFPRTNSFSRSQLNYDSGEVKNIHYGDIHTKFNTLFDVSNEKVPFINSNVSISNFEHESYCREGDLVIADASEDYKDVGKAIEIVRLNGEKIMAGLHTYIARPVQGYIAAGFFGYLFQSNKIRNQIMKMATGISVLGISKTNLMKLAVQIPCFAEQKKIALILSAVDQKIMITSIELKKSAEWKKGLLQQMFV